MKKTAALILILSMGLFFCGNAYSGEGAEKETVTQISTLNALLMSIFDGEVTIKELKKYGDFGMGTFNGLDGEMLVLDGRVYQIPGDGKVREVDDGMLTPFATMTFFEADKTAKLHGIESYDAFKKEADALIPTPNIFYAYKMKGTFKAIKARSVGKQTKPYPPIKEIVGVQSIFNFENVKGTMVGFRCPPYAKGMNAPGYHFHFLTEDGKAGGHVLEFSVQDAVIEIDETSNWSVILPSDKVFYGADFTPKK